MAKLSTFSFITGYGKTKTVQDLSDTEKRNEIRAYFEYDKKIRKVNKNIPWLLLICMIITIATGGVGIISFFFLFRFLKVKPVISDAQYFNWYIEDLKKINEKAKEEMQISGEDLTSLVFTIVSPVSGKEAELETVNDATKVITDPEIEQVRGKCAYAPAHYTILLELEKQIMTYECRYDIRTDKVDTKVTREFYYKDVVEVGTERVKSSKGDFTQFSLKNSGASTFSVPLDTPERVRETMGSPIVTGDVDNLIAHIRQNVRKFK